MIKKAGALLLILILAGIVSASDKGTITVDISGSDGECNLNLINHYNFFSFCSNLQNPSISNVFSAIQGNYRFIARWNPAAQEFEYYDVMNPNKPFTNFNDEEAYFVYMNQPSLLNVPGDEAGLESRNLLASYNAPSYPYRSSKPIETMIQNIRSDLRFLSKWNPAIQNFDYYDVMNPEKPFTEINSGEGQLLYMLNPNTLQYT